MADFEDIKKEPIYVRKTRLKQLLLGRGTGYGLEGGFGNGGSGTSRGQARPNSNEGEGQGQDEGPGGDGDGPANLTITIPPVVSGGEGMFNGETLLDAFLVLYEECCSQVKKDGITPEEEGQMKHFIQKFESVVSDLKVLRINSSDFRVGDIIGRGTYGQVHLTREKASGSYFAMKIFNKSDSQVQKNLSSLELELEIMSKVTSPWLTRLQYGFQDLSRIMFVMEYVPGGTYLDLLQRNGGSLSEDNARFYLAQIVMALNEVHSMGFAHRDLKPENILIDKFGHVKLTEFGSASKVNSYGNVTSAFTIISPNYIAPEVLQSLEKDPEKESQFYYGIGCDYWSLGVISYETLFKVSPFAGENSLTTYVKIVSFMDHLTFPPTPTISEDCLEFIKGLLTDEFNRINYGQALRHPFFNPIIWDSLRTDIPPCIVPFKSKEPQTCNGSLHEDEVLQRKGPAVGTSFFHVPFIGFTRTLFSGTFLNNLSGSLNRSFNNSLSFIESPNVSLTGSKLLNDRPAEQRHSLFNIPEEPFENSNSSQLRALENTVIVKDELLQEKDTELSKIFEQLKRVQSEKNQLIRDLKSERNSRLNLEVQTQQNLADLKGSHLKELNELKDQLDYQNILISERNSTISELEGNVTKLRSELKRVQAEVSRAELAREEIQQKVARTYRGSISNIESRFEQNTAEFEAKIASLISQHEDEIKALKYAEQIRETQVKEQLGVKGTEIHELQGRLKEAQASREATLEEMRIDRKKFHSTIRGLEQCLEEVLQKGQKKEEEQSLLNFKQIENCESENEALRSQVSGLNIKLTSTEQEVVEFKGRICDLEATVTKLEGNVRILEEEKTDLISKTKELTQRGQDSDFQRGAIQILQEQLDKSQTALEASRQELFQEVEKRKNLDQQLYKLNEELKVTKVDLKLLERDKKTLDEEIKHYVHGSKESEVKMNAALEEKGVVERKVSELSRENSELKEKFEERDRDLRELEAKLEETQRKLVKSRNDFNDMVVELARCNGMLEEFYRLRLTIDERDEVFKQKDALIEVGERRVQQLQASIGLLKEACEMLEDQLKDFEVILGQKNAQIEEVERSRTRIETELQTVKEDMRKTKSELNETKNTKCLVDKQLTSLQSDFESLKTSKDSEIKDLTQKLGEKEEKIEELTQEVELLMICVEEVQHDKTIVAQQVEKLQEENEFIRDGSSRTIGQFVKIKEHNIDLKSQLDEALVKAHHYKEKFEFLSDTLYSLEAEKSENELKLQSILDQHVKYIAHLQTQHENLSRKKKSFTDRLFGRGGSGGNSPLVVPTPSPSSGSHDLLELGQFLSPPSPSLISSSSPAPSSITSGGSRAWVRPFKLLSELSESESSP